MLRRLKRHCSEILGNSFENKRVHKQGRKCKLEQSSELKAFVFEKLKLRWSPDQIARELKTVYPDDMHMRISHETIYTYIYVLPRGSFKKELLSYLRQQKKYRRRRGKNQPRKDKKRGTMPEMISIEERPKEVEDRIIPGHWEGDLILANTNVPPWKQ